MTTLITLGITQDRKPLLIDLDLLIATRLLVQASSGQGKTRTIRRLLEQTHGRVQHLVIDPEGEYHTLREKFDYILAAPSGGDVVAHPRYARHLAHELLKLGVSAILDIYELEPDDRLAFVAEFVAGLVNAPRNSWHPCLVVLDEAHVFCPEGSKSDSAKAIESLASKGRKRGFCLIAATQRIAKFKKDAAAELGNKLIGGCNLDVDIDRAGEELGIAKAKRVETLRGIAPGTFYAYGRAFGVVQPVSVKVGDVATTHAEQGTAPVPVPPPTAKVKAALAHLSNLPAKVEEEAQTLQSLNREVNRLSQELRLRDALLETAPISTTTEVQVLLDGEIARVVSVTEQLREQKDALIDQVGKVLGMFGGQVEDALTPLTQKIVGVNLAHPLVGSLGDLMDLSIKLNPPIIQDTETVTVTAHELSQRSTRSVSSELINTGISGPEQRILDAIMWFNAIGVVAPVNSAVAFMAGYTPGGGGYLNPRGRLRKLGHISYGDDVLILTKTGRALAKRVDTSMLTNEALHAAVLQRLQGPERKLLRALISAYPRKVRDADLAKASGYAEGGGAFANPKGRLRTLGLIEYPEPKHARAKDLLFPRTT